MSTDSNKSVSSTASSIGWFILVSIGFLIGLAVIILPIIEFVYVVKTKQALDTYQSSNLATDLTTLSDKMNVTYKLGIVVFVFFCIISIRESSSLYKRVF